MTNPEIRNSRKKDSSVYSIGRGPRYLCETSLNITNWVIDSFGWFCETFVKGMWLEGGNLVL